nr:unnamed protein product [Callosobruchus chinensis]
MYFLTFTKMPKLFQFLKKGM